MDADLRTRLERMTAEMGLDPYSDAPPKTALGDDGPEPPPSPNAGFDDEVPFHVLLFIYTLVLGPSWTKKLCGAAILCCGL
ncbi:hypothetical protein MRX96_035265 [Rhipicephalus microplus]